jgi:hypothetical protein
MPRQSQMSWMAEQIALHRDMPRLEPIFGCRALASSTTCADIHPGGDLPEGTRCCCMVCHATGGRTQACIDRLYGTVSDAERPRPERYRYKPKPGSTRRRGQGRPGAATAAA